MFTSINSYKSALDLTFVITDIENAAFFCIFKLIL